MERERYFRSTQATGTLFPSTHSSPTEPEHHDCSHTHCRGSQHEWQHPGFPQEWMGNAQSCSQRMVLGSPPSTATSPASAGEGRWHRHGACYWVWSELVYYFTCHELSQALTQGGGMEQAVPVTSGGQGKQPLATGIHIRPPVQTTCGNIWEHENKARYTTWDYCVHPFKKRRWGLKSA